MREQRRRVWIALAVLLSVSFAVVAHFAIVAGASPALGAALSLVPLAGLAFWAARRSRHRLAWLAAALATTAALWFWWGALERHFPDIFFVEHAGANLVLAIVFGRTLLKGHEALCTKFARVLHGPLAPNVERYTRQVTIAWTIFFVALFAASCALYLGRFLAAWSLLANILSPVLIVAMFVVEYAVRHRVLPGHERVGILGGIRAFSRHFRTARFEAPR
jgi:uncharacterized membrane protein